MSEPNTLDEDATNDETFDADVEPEFLVPQLATLASEESVNEEEEEVALPDDVSDEVHVSSDHDDGMEEEEPGEVKNPKKRMPFPRTRVKELLKFNSTASVIASDAVLAAGEAVELILKDLAECAAVEAKRNGRKTINYGDIARVISLMDRFSFLSDVIPMERGAVAGTLPKARKQQRNALAAQQSGTQHRDTNIEHTNFSHPAPKQTTLRF